MHGHHLPSRLYNIILQHVYAIAAVHCDTLNVKRAPACAMCFWGVEDVCVCHALFCHVQICLKIERLVVGDHPPPDPASKRSKMLRGKATIACGAYHAPASPSWKTWLKAALLAATKKCFFPSIIDAVDRPAMLTCARSAAIPSYSIP